MGSKKKLWVLTTSYNLYDQQGVYFLAAWPVKPNAEEVRAALQQDIGRPPREVVVEHVLQGGGREAAEYQWYYLSAVNPGEVGRG